MIEDRGSRCDDRGAMIEDRGATIEDRGAVSTTVRPCMCQDTVMFLRDSFSSSHFDISRDTRLSRGDATIERASCF